MRYTRAIVVALTLASPAQAQQKYIGPPPGAMVDIGGRKLHLLCSGVGAPTIVLEAGASAFAIDFTLVQREVARTNRVCSYDRAGFGWSDPPAPSPKPSAAHDLHRLLQAAGERPPFVLVGASLGGMFVRVYQADYPAEVAGLVLIDPASEDRLFTYFGGQPVTIASLTAEQVASMLPRQSVRVPRRNPQTGAPFDLLPPHLYEIRQELDARLIASVPEWISPEMFGEAREEERARLSRLLQLRAGKQHPLGELPVVVLTRGLESNAGLVETHEGLARLSANSRQTSVTGAGHEIHLFAPDVVVRAIADVVEVVRGRTRLRSL